MSERRIKPGHTHAAQALIAHVQEYADRARRAGGCSGTDLLFAGLVGLGIGLWMGGE